MSRKHQRSHSSGHTILVVDDDDNVRTSLRALLEREGHQVVEAPDGAAGVALALEQSFDLMLLDFLMPEMTGEQVVEAVRKRNRDLQIVLQTGYANEHPPREMLKRLDIQGYHDKSEGPEKLLIWVDSALKANRHLRAIRQTQRGLMQILQVTPDIYRIQPLEQLLDGIFMQVLGFLSARDGFMATVGPDGLSIHGFLATRHEDGFALPFKSGRFASEHQLPAAMASEIEQVIAKGEIQVGEEATLVPLVVGERTIGAVYLECTPPPEADLQMLQVFANQAAVAIENLQLYEAITHDAMTGVLSRSYFMQRVNESLQLAVRHDHPLTVLMLDLDKFKSLNDTQGHALGDQAIIRFAKAIGECLRGGDLVGRYGGDEFVVLLPETSPEAATPVAERICQRVREIVLDGCEVPVRLTTSIGVGGFSSFGLGPDGWKSTTQLSVMDSLQEDLMGMADAALYIAKERGRDGHAMRSYDEVALRGA